MKYSITFFTLEMDYIYLKNNAYKYAHLSKSGTFVQNNNEIIPLEFPESGIFYLYKEDDNIDFLSLAANSSSASITLADGGSQTLFDQSAVNLIYTIDVTPIANIVDNYIQSKIASVTVTTSVNGIENSETRTFASPKTFMQFFGKLEDKSTDKITISATNCSVTGNVKFVYDKLYDN